VPSSRTKLSPQSPALFHRLLLFPAIESTTTTAPSAPNLGSGGLSYQQLTILISVVTVAFVIAGTLIAAYQFWWTKRQKRKEKRERERNTQSSATVPYNPNRTTTFNQYSETERVTIDIDHSTTNILYTYTRTMCLLRFSLVRTQNWFQCGRTSIWWRCSASLVPQFLICLRVSLVLAMVPGYSVAVRVGTAKEPNRT